jgi:2,4-didehydro-3-deoxy-L-rhamnonate hydrolase
MAQGGSNETLALHGSCRAVVEIAPMKLFRFGASGNEKPGLIVAGEGRVDVSGFGEDYDERFFATDGCARLQSWYEAHRERCSRVGADERIGPAICRPSKIVCIGRNYREHAKETGAEVPTEPLLFMKATSALSGPYDDVVLPRGSEKTDWEVELAVVIGKKASYVTRERAMEHVAGFVLHNDYSERAFQRDRGGQWTKGKSADSFAPIGPFVATPDEVDPRNLRLWLRVSGELMQDATTADLIFDIPTLISYTSEFMTLLPGDVLSTGTPSGVGLGRTPPRFLKPGDVVEYGIDGLGEARQNVVAWDS